MAQQEKQYFYGTGKRKTSIARVYLRLGAGEVSVNNRSLDNYFGNQNHRIVVNQPLALVNLENRFDIKVFVRGGGTSGQAEAVRYGITRALLEYNDTLKPALRAAGFVTRDARKVERKKAGLRKARKTPQYSKR